jgi:hypothetical protein
MICANRVFPLFMAASPGNPADCLKIAFQIQIDTTPHCLETSISHGFQQFTPSFNRTVVSLAITLRPIVQPV